MIGRKVPIWGKLPCKYLIIGEGPGKVEANSGIPFQGAAGADLEWVYLKRAAKMRRSDFAITNVVKYRTDEDDSDPTEIDIQRDEEELMAEIMVCDPEIIIAVGKVAARWLLSDGDSFTQWVKDIRAGNWDDVNMDEIHGVPMICPRYPDKRMIVCLHPAAGLHQAERYYQQIFWDFQQVGRLIRGEISCYEPQGVLHYSEVDDNFSLGQPALVAVDTEGSVSQPWGLSISAEEGRAFVLRGSEDSPAKDAIRQAFRERVVMHNALYDIPVLEALHTPVPLDRVEDTMLLAYLLPHLPRGLKPLAFKLFGIKQPHYENVVKEAEEKICREYLQLVLKNICILCSGTGEELVPYKRQPAKLKSQKCSVCGGDGTGWPLPAPKLVFDNNGVGRVTKPRSIGRIVRGLLERGTGLREGWTSIDNTLRSTVEDHIGRMREVTLDDVPLETAVNYSAADADITLRTFNKLAPIVRREGLWNVYQIDKGIIPIIDRMQRNGILIDKEHFKNLEVQFRGEQEELSKKLTILAGKPINPASPLQTAEFIYDILKVKTLHGKRSTDEKTLETLKIKNVRRADVREAVDIITDYRELSKLLGTYVETLPGYADVNGWIHTRFLLHVTHTGRLASRDPNLQNQPTRSERGRLIRKGFIPRPGCRLVSVDLDQIELRVAAHLSQDQNMIDVFCTGKDIHRATASLIYNKPMELITTQERLLSKTINFLIMYGGGAGKLNSELALLGITTTKDECVDYINNWFEAYPGVRDYIDRCHTQAESVGYVEDLFGRRRYVQGVWSCVDRVREESRKWAANMPVTSTAAGLLKIWLKRIMDNVLPEYWEKGVYCEPLLTVHDEVILETQEGVEDEVIQRVVYEAAQSMELSVPIAAKGSSAYDWAALK